MSKNPLKVIAGAPDRPLIIGNIEIPCYVLEDETRVLSQRGMVSGLGFKSQGGSSGVDSKVPRFLTSKRLKPFIPNELMVILTEPILFTLRKGPVIFGYPATALPDVCEVVLSARDEDKLLKSQQRISEQCELIMRGLARVGIIALVDEATGFQRIREERALATILEEFIAKELQPWTRTFPYEFYVEICRLKGWPSIYAVKRPSVIGRYTNDIVYERLATGVLDELKARTPRLPSGNLKNKLFQWFTPDLGHPKLREHLVGVMALMRAAPKFGWGNFQRSLQRAYPKLNETIPMPLDD